MNNTHTPMQWAFAAFALAAALWLGRLLLVGGLGVALYAYNEWGTEKEKAAQQSAAKTSQKKEKPEVRRAAPRLTERNE